MPKCSLQMELRSAPTSERKFQPDFPTTVSLASPGPFVIPSRFARTGTATAVPMKIGFRGRAPVTGLFEEPNVRSERHRSDAALAP